MTARRWYDAGLTCGLDDAFVREHRERRRLRFWRRRATKAELVERGESSAAATFGDMRHEPIAELADRSVPTRMCQRDVGRAPHVRMRVGDRHAAPGDPHAVGIV